MSTKRRRSSAEPESASKRVRIDIREWGISKDNDPREYANENTAIISSGAIPAKDDYLARLSDELIVRVLHYIDLQDLISCQRVSNRINRLSGDSQVWKRLYYEAFVRKRALRVPGAREREEEEGRVVGSSRKANWLGEEIGVKRKINGKRQGDEVDWKRQYKLRHNWSRGACEVDEIRIGERGRDELSLLVRLVEGIVVTADVEGLRAWDLKNKSLLAESGMRYIPSSLAVDDQKATKGGDIDVAVGFDNGAFGIWRLGAGKGKFEMVYEHPASSNGRLSALAYTYPYILTITDSQLLSLYTFDPKPPIPLVDILETQDSSEEQSKSGGTSNPRLLSSLKSHSAWPPLSLSLRSTSQSIIASIAYALPTFLTGWSVGLQELHLTPNGEISNSRLASAVETGFQPLLSAIPSSPPPSSPSRTQQTPPTPERQSRPTSLSYSHPYLLASHPDNTLTLYLVNSTTSHLAIKKDTKLWGHTSAVSGAHVGGRGKAVSVSRRGNELRVWELEGGVGSTSSKRRQDSRSVVVRPDNEKITEPLSLALLSGSGSESGIRNVQVVNDIDAVKGWVGFDDEVVIVLKESGEGTRALMVYDFT